MKKIHALANLLIILMLAVSCSAPVGEGPQVKDEKNAAERTETPAKAEYHKISAEDAKERMDSGDELIILDVRTQAEYDEEHIAGAILIPNETIGDEMPELLPDLDAEILIYCRSGRRSAEAAKKLVDLGYTNVYDFGGIVGWPYSTVDGDEKTIEVFEETGE
jgi:phage shock protein E